MTCERADDKCETCGKKLEWIASDAEFEDKICCIDCMGKDCENIMGMLYEPEG